MKGDGGGGLNKSDNQGTTLGPGRAYLFPSPKRVSCHSHPTTPLPTPYTLDNECSCVGMYMYIYVISLEGISQRPSSSSASGDDSAGGIRSFWIAKAVVYNIL